MAMMTSPGRRVLIASVLVIGGCTARLDVQVLLPLAPDPYLSVEVLRVDLLRDEEPIGSEELSYKEPGTVSLTLRAPPGPGTVVVLTGLDRAGNVVSRGRSMPVDVLERGDASTSLLFTQVGELSELSSLVEARSAHTATRLRDGRVLLIGGVTRDCDMGSPAVPATTLEVWDPRCACFRVLADGVLPPRSRHAAALMSDGRVLVFGGTDLDCTTALNDAYLLLIDGDSVNVLMLSHQVSGMLTPAVSRLESSADVLVVGDAGLFQLSANGATVALASDLPAGTVDMTVAPLGGDELLVAGGMNGLTLEYLDYVGRASPGGLSAVDPAPGFGAATMAGPRSRLTATTLPGGNVLLFGGASGAGTLAAPELYVAATDGIIPVGIGTNDVLERSEHTATHVPRLGAVLIAGGTPGIPPQVFNELAQPTLVVDTLDLPAYDRSFHTATLLTDGTVLVVGGRVATDSIAGVELFNP